MVAAALSSTLIVAACESSSTGGTQPTPKENTEDKPKVDSPPEALKGDPIWLKPRAVVGRSVRTTRTLYSTEVTPDGRKLTQSSKETYVQKTNLADALGQATSVTRFYEQSQVRVESPGHEPVVEVNAREGATVEIKQSESRVLTEVLAGSPSSDELQRMLITGFDVGLLPLQAVRLGQRWTIDIKRNPGLNDISRAFGVNASKNELSAMLYSHEAGISKISIEWEVQGTIGEGTPLVIQLVGNMELDHTSGLITKLELGGGKTDSEGKVIPQIAIEIVREELKAWYD